MFTSRRKINRLADLMVKYNIHSVATPDAIFVIQNGLTRKSGLIVPRPVIAIRSPITYTHLGYLRNGRDYGVDEAIQEIRRARMEWFIEQAVGMAIRLFKKVDRGLERLLY